VKADKKRQRYQSAEQGLEFFVWRGPIDFSSRLVIIDEPLLYHYEPESKQQAKEWQHRGSPHPKILRVQNSAGKVLDCSTFWDQTDILLIDYIPKGQTMKAE
jgi:hypothetical protein